MLREFQLDPITKTTDEDTIYSLIAKRAARDPEGMIAQWQDDDTHQWVGVNAGQMLDTVRQVAKGLMGLGVRAGSMVVIYAATCYQWGIVDFACAAIGAVSVPIYETDSPKQASHIVKEVNPIVAFADDSQHAQTLEELRHEHNELKYVFSFTQDGLNAVADFGRSIDDADLDRAISRVKADDMLTIVYTSGSTGAPKGVMLSHRNFVSTVFIGWAVLDDMLYQPSRLLLFLPLAHCFARYIQYVAIGSQGVVGYTSNTKRLLSDLRTFKPTYLLGVPRVFEKVYNAASQKAGAGLQGRVFNNSFTHFVKWSKDEQDGNGHTLLEKAKHSFYMKTVGASVRSALGPNLKYLACGGAPMNADLAHFFNGMDGITFIQGYGMTETAAPCIVAFQDFNKVGAVGRPGSGIAVKLADDDELLINGEDVFLGYYKQPELTAEATEPGGWVHSGDIAQIDDDGFVYITGRKKDIIITAGGKNISPAPLEDVIGTCPLVSHAVVIGDGKPFISALIELEPDMVRSWLKASGMDSSMPMSQIAQNDAVRANIQQYVDQANSTVSRAESVRKFVVLEDEFTQEAGTLTPSMKVVRPKVLEKYADVINNQIYAPKAGVRQAPSAAVELIDRAAVSVRQASDAVSPKVRKAFDQAKQSVNGHMKADDGSVESDTGAQVTGGTDVVTSGEGAKLGSTPDQSDKEE
ncbi:long-chain acyl-CoA synthetase [Bifidobacterium bohemicum]|uniref:Acyl-CoA synthetase n=1 Tax=Bifidobacterium bohemicum DSM 22767 TaxID=1437606 RepID=A0A086ZJ97_9BIFI|nr:AMP-dependent synthetase/ligase [Bifidobacterium bohemicum]KFI46597.1 AMP-binding enzyme, putative long-chain-fatty-acid--CoA ligase [Bifidobacterium bohemicum DSM 22767]SCB76301.1 long-chain acyl-CoA synthetase [Bifidobacterium bohemicum]